MHILDILDIILSQTSREKVYQLNQELSTLQPKHDQLLEDNKNLTDQNQKKDEKLTTTEQLLHSANITIQTLKSEVTETLAAQKRLQTENVRLEQVFYVIC